MTSSPMRHGQDHTSLIKHFLEVKFSAVSWNWLPYPSRSLEDTEGNIHALIEGYKVLNSESFSSPALTHPDIWHQFESIFDHIDFLDTSLALSQKELYGVLNNLRATLFSDQPLLLESLSNPLFTGLIHILHCVCTALYALLYVGEIYPPLCGFIDICISLHQRKYLLSSPRKMIHFNWVNFMLTLAICWINATSRLSLVQMLAQTQY